jgi:tRNA(Arg) A34 adenosine deaminase TadA|tara:strand:- start:1391 stop:1810 length:420 start_codon:yes stop_codon:yes gene_type:complete
MRFVNMAATEAQKSPVLYKHGCVAVVSGKVVARGHNNYRTSSKDGLIGNNCSCHAEIDVLRKCMKLQITKKLNIYVVRVNNLGKFAMSLPCLECYESMKNFSVKNVVYSDYNNQLLKQSMRLFKTSYQTYGQRNRDKTC